MNSAQTAQAEHESLKYVLLPVAVAALGGLLFGFDTVVINGAIAFLKLSICANRLTDRNRSQQSSAPPPAAAFFCRGGRH